jgi:transcriptional regulator CtsR
LIESGDELNVSLGGGGKFRINDFKIEERVTFLDYIMGGCAVNVHVAVDFTLSNGDP